MLDIDRRRLLQLGTFGVAALAVPGTAAALRTARGFTHGVASGEPSPRSVLLWTRFVGKGDARLHAEVSESESFDRVVAHADLTASPEHDFCAKATATGLKPGRWYYYRFRGPGGAISATGRTRTLPEGPTARFTLGLFSCSNLPFGFFNAYGHAAARSDLDAIVHVGDYLYEYQRGHYPGSGEAVPGRVINPATELIHLTDYRLRHAAYRADPDLQQMLQRLPLIAMWDDHESANDSWAGGAENHQPETEGPWSLRKAAAVRAYREWLPVSDAIYAEYQIGDLATIFRPETRLTARTEQLHFADALKGQADLRAALIAFRDGPWSDPARTMMGAAQERQLAEGFKRSSATGTRWQVLAQGTVMGSISVPAEAAQWVAQADEQARTATKIGLLASSVGLPLNLDDWDGYPAARDRLLQSAQNANANLIVLSGDSHNAWAFDLAHGGAPAGVEFGGHSVTSPGYESSFPAISPRALERAVVGRNKQLKWANIERRGYVAVELTPARATSDWVLLDTIRKRSTALAGTHRMAVAYGSNSFGDQS